MRHGSATPIAVRRYALVGVVDVDVDADVDDGDVDVNCVDDDVDDVSTGGADQCERCASACRIASH
jgi:hypothetical protein